MCNTFMLSGKEYTGKRVYSKISDISSVLYTWDCNAQEIGSGLIYVIDLDRIRLCIVT